MGIETLKKIDEFRLEEFDYHLPKEKIAEYPLQERSQSKLLLYDITKNEIKHHHFFDIPELLPQNSVLVLNESKVIPARLFFKKNTGGLVEIFCLEPSEPSNDPQITLQTKSTCVWNCFIGGRKVKNNQILALKNSIDNVEIRLSATILDKIGNEALVKFNWTPLHFTFAKILKEIGKIPLPPYISRDAERLDIDRYQTVYAQSSGSVAAPTAGLHFTEVIIEKLKAKNIPVEKITLHVGAGTFKPVDNEIISQHIMHYEMFQVTLSFVENIINLLKNNQIIIATGTTTLRTLESLFWCGVKLIHKLNEPFSLSQWESYDLKKFNVKPIEALEAVIDYLRKNKIDKFVGNTQLFILPGYEFKLVNCLITNFHVPKSTLIMLVAAFAGGENWKNIYSAALSNEYRFLSYGDCSLILP